MLDEIREKFEEIDFSGKTKYLLFSVILLGLFFGSAYASYTSIAVFKPMIFGLEFRDLPVTVDSVKLAYNVDTNRYSEATITLRNNANQNFDNLKVSVNLMNNTIIAQGEIITNLSANQVKTVTISLTWLSNTDIRNCTSGKITLSS
jgi:hypothetical protein